MNILVTGANGQLGTHLRLRAQQSTHHYLFTDVAELDITQPQAINHFVERQSINLIVNCAAYTNVDRAESDEANAHLLNATAVGYLANAMKHVEGTLIHISTDYVFGGTLHNLPCTEAEPANPTGAYGRTKWAGEQAASQCDSLIIRTSWLYSEYGKNFALTMLNLTATKPEVRVVFDQVGTPTYAGDLAQAIITLIEQGTYRNHLGTYHYANEGVCSWYDFATAIAQMAGHTQCRVLPCHSNEYPSPVQRPAYSVLDKTKIKQTFGLDIPHWTTSLAHCLNNIQQPS